MRILNFGFFVQGFLILVKIFSWVIKGLSWVVWGLTGFSWIIRCVRLKGSFPEWGYSHHQTVLTHVFLGFLGYLHSNRLIEPLLFTSISLYRAASMQSVSNSFFAFLIIPSKQILFSFRSGRSALDYGHFAKKVFDHGPSERLKRHSKHIM